MICSRCWNNSTKAWLAELCNIFSPNFLWLLWVFLFFLLLLDFYLSCLFSACFTWMAATFWPHKLDLFNCLVFLAVGVIVSGGWGSWLTIWVSLVIRLCYLYVVYLLPNMRWFSSDGPSLLGWFLVERALPLLAFHCFKSTANYSSISRFQFVWGFSFLIHHKLHGQKVCKKCLNTAFCVVFFFY